MAMTMTMADHAAAHAAKADVQVAEIERQLREIERHLQSATDRKIRQEKRLRWWRARQRLRRQELNRLEEGEHMSYWPITLRVSPNFLAEVAEEEMGSYEDHGLPDPGTVPGYAAQGDDDPVEHAYNILTRHKGKLELRDGREVKLIQQHVLDNSIDKARGFCQEYSDGTEHMKAMAWLKNLRRLRSRISEACVAALPDAP